MAPVEASIYCQNIKNNVDFLTVPAGKADSITCLGGVKVSAFCNAQDSKGMIQVDGNYEEFEAMLTEETEGGVVGRLLEAEELSTGVAFSGDQEITIYSTMGHNELVTIRHDDPYLPKGLKISRQTTKRDRLINRESVA